MEIDDGGTAKVVTGVTEIGEGILTLLAQVAAEEIRHQPGLRHPRGQRYRALPGSRACRRQTRQTYMIGNAVALACQEARKRLFTEIADYWEVDIDRLQAFNGELSVREANKRMPMAEAVAICKARGVVPVGSGHFTSHGTGLDPVEGTGRPWQAYVFGAQVAEVEVDGSPYRRGTGARHLGRA